MGSFCPELNKMFNDAMRSNAKVFAKAVLSKCRDVFCGVGSLVDVEGGTGHMVSEIVKEFPDIKGINFDMPHVVATAPEYNGVSHVAGDMFKEIPTADAIFIKGILHDWDDEDCITILRNCRKAINKGTGKIIIADIILKAEGEEEGQIGNLDVIFDILIMAHCRGGKERTELEWKKILEEGGFPRYNIIETPISASVIEAYPE